jgi:hypothetical protein
MYLCCIKIKDMTQEVREILDRDIKKRGKEVLIETFKRDLKKCEEGSYTEEQKALVKEVCEEALEYLSKQN